MPVTVRSFAKINLGLKIGGTRPDGFHELRTIYQTIGLHDRITVEVKRGSGIEIICSDPRVPRDDSNTCWHIADLTMQVLQRRGRVVIQIEKRLPVQGGLGGASANAAATLLALEMAVGKRLTGSQRLRIGAAVGSDVPLFVVGGTVLGVGRGEEVYTLPDLPSLPCVVALPEVGVSTPKAFAAWDALQSRLGLTQAQPPDTIKKLYDCYFMWQSGTLPRKQAKSGKSASGVPISRVGNRAETLLLDLDRTGIENDFEQVVFPQNPELIEAKRALRRAGAWYASLSGSGSALFGLFPNRDSATQAALRLQRKGIHAVVTRTLTRREYWRKLFV